MRFFIHFSLWESLEISERVFIERDLIAALSYAQFGDFRTMLIIFSSQEK
ncbi:hypothetical protein BH160DRAFT_4921 [Burkholderia sp. H160]|nr:hypothetical protein BH160DRAFT_4921 [Burkholderia sp. H160]